jgi:hypothetical protein
LRGIWHLALWVVALDAAAVLLDQARTGKKAAKLRRA